MMMEWHYNRLKSLSTEAPNEDGLDRLAAVQKHKPFALDATDRFCVEQGWVRVEESSFKPRYGFLSGSQQVKYKLVTPEGQQAMADAEAAWEKNRKDDPEWGPAEFWAVDTNQGQVLVRVPERCGEIAEHACRMKFGDCWPKPVRRQDDCHQWIGGLGAYLDAMHPEGMPQWRTFTGRPLGDAGMEFRVTCGLPPTEF